MILTTAQPTPGHQLPPRLPRPRLHHPPGGRRQPDPLQLHRRLRPQRRSCRPDGLLLERALGEGKGQAPRRRPRAEGQLLKVVRPGRLRRRRQHHAFQEGALDPQARLSESACFWRSGSGISFSKRSDGSGGGGDLHMFNPGILRCCCRFLSLIPHLSLRVLALRMRLGLGFIWPVR